MRITVCCGCTALSTSTQLPPSPPPPSGCWLMAKPARPHGPSPPRATYFSYFWCTKWRGLS